METLATPMQPGDAGASGRPLLGRLLLHCLLDIIYTAKPDLPGQNGINQLKNVFKNKLQFASFEEADELVKR